VPRLEWKKILNQLQSFKYKCPDYIRLILKSFEYVNGCEETQNNTCLFEFFVKYSLPRNKLSLDLESCEIDFLLFIAYLRIFLVISPFIV
jgi:hypothetical protein